MVGVYKPLFVSCALALATLAHGDPPDRVEKLLQTLADASGPPGFEEPVRAIMVRELKPLATRLSYDGLGSVVAQHGSSGPRIMLDAHMDELGGMVRRIGSDGFLTMEVLGSWLNQALPDQRWVIVGSKGVVHAVSGIRDIHVMPRTDFDKPVLPTEIFLDTGAHNTDEVERLGIQPGDPVAPDAPFAELNSTGRYTGKAFDDRAGCAVVIEALRRLAEHGHPNQLFVTATVQEEIGLRGAQTAANVVRPDVGITIEGGVSGDVPVSHPDESQARLGGGPSMFLYDASSLPNRRLLALTREVARNAGIALQVDLVEGYGENSAQIQRSGTGAPTVNIGVPVRYMHAHVGVMDRADFDRTVDLVVALIERLDAATVERLRDFTP